MCKTLATTIHTAMVVAMYAIVVSRSPLDVMFTYITVLKLKFIHDYKNHFYDN